MSAIRTRPEPNTTALGGVATGSMNAQLADSAAGTISSAGSNSADLAAAPTPRSR